MTDEFERIEGISILIDERPCMFWGDLSQTNDHFLARMRPEFWLYEAKAHAGGLGNPESAQHAASALRIAYGQGVETLLVLLASVAQAPHFAMGWVAKYQNHELRSVVRKIHTKVSLPCGWDKSLSWDRLSDIVHARVPESIRSETQLVSHFGSAWRSIAGQFLESHFEPEYNSLKHGMRAYTGPWGISVGRNPPSEHPNFTSRAEFGSTFERPVKIPGYKYSYEFEDISVAWSPNQFLARLRLRPPRGFASLGDKLDHAALARGRP